MIPRELASLTPARRAEVIYAQAHNALASRLWRAALGEAEGRDANPLSGSSADMSMDSLLSMFGGPTPPATSAPMPVFCPRAEAIPLPILEASEVPEPSLAVAPVATETGSRILALGSNARYGPAFEAAAARTGVPAPALAAIVDAEAAKRGDGSWNPHSRNPRSSAAGLGQFLSGTWQTLAQTDGTWLNQVARQRGWLDARGRVLPAARTELLALRYDPDASIASVADLAKINLDRLERDGIHVRTDGETLAKAAYLSHHLGLGDTRRFLGRGLDPQRARVLLAAQVGSATADRRIAEAGGATQAHRQWLLGYIDRRIRPERYAAANSGRILV